MIGQTISHYEILEKLGEGGMGVVYRARDTRLQRDVALKFIHFDRVDDEVDMQRFLREARAASSLDHVNICSIHSIENMEDGQTFIVMPFYNGFSLKERMAEGPLPVAEVLDVARQTAAGLQKAHEKEIVHRDLKPDNLLLTNDGQLKIIDFGLAKVSAQSALTKHGSTLGTMPYMSPEQAQGGDVDHRTDIWSLGIVMYEMLTGIRPFTSEYESALIYSILNEDPAPVTSLRSGVPLELESIITKCLEKNPAERYQHADELLVDVRKTAKRLEVSSSASPSSAKGRNHRITGEDANGANRSGMLRRPFVRVAALVAVLVIIGGYFFFPERGVAVEIEASIAVLPFESLNTDPDDHYFAAGIHEDIIIQLSRIAALQVIGRSSVSGYAPEGRNIQQISTALGVRTILEGSVRRIGERVRVSVSLTDAVTNRTLWAESYDRNLTDVFAIQTEIAREIAWALAANLTVQEEQQMTLLPTEVTDAYEHYLRARALFNEPGMLEENYRRAKDLLDQAIELDPAFAHAIALRSRAYSNLYWFGFEDSPEALANSLRDAEEALALSPRLPEAHVAMGYHHYYGHRDYEKALDHFNIAWRGQPNNSDIISAVGFVERRLGRFEDAIKSLEHAISLDPLNLNLVYAHAQSQMLVRQYEQAAAGYEKLLSHAPDVHTIHIMRTLNCYLWKGEAETVQAFLQDFDHLKSDFMGDWIRFEYLIGDFEGMIASVDENPQDFYDNRIFYILEPSYVKGLAYEHMGQKDRARGFYRSSLEVMENLMPDHESDARYHSALGKIYAGLGMREQAIASGEKAVALVPPHVDAFTSTVYLEELAAIYVMLDMPEEAVGVLREALAKPGYLSVAMLQNASAWSAIRDTPEFLNLIASAN